MKTTKVVKEDGKLANELLGQIYRKVGEIVRRIADGTLTVQWVLDELQRIVEGRKVSEIHHWVIWKWVIANIDRTMDELCRAVEENGYAVEDDFTEKLLKSPDCKLVEKRTRLGLVAVEASYFGLKRVGDRFVFLGDAYKRAQELGLQFCPCEVGLLLCTNGDSYPEVPLLQGEEYLIAMEPVHTEEMEPRILVIDTGKRTIKFDVAFPKSPISEDSFLVFCARRETDYQTFAEAHPELVRRIS